MIKPVEWREGRLRYLDQRKLPQQECYVDASTEVEVGEAIRSLAIRGAPLIGITAAYGVALAIHRLSPDTDPATIRVRFENAISVLGSSRPTAVNLFWALERMRRVFEQYGSRGIDLLKDHLLEEARQIHREDEMMCRKIGEYGAAILPNAVTILTHCNTGALATGGIGTAQGVIQTAWTIGKLKHVYVDETRPLFQGARLTAWELSKLQIPFTLITDNTAAFLMQRRLITAVVVGADRIARNGDTANKIGTYGLAVLARHHGIPFYIAAPSSTIDAETPNGKSIPIEQRSADEVTRPFGLPVAPEGVDVYSPAFDITPQELISAIITEGGVSLPPYEFSSRGA